MADVKVDSMVTFRVTDSEWKLIMRGLAVMAGVKMDVKPEMQNRAEVLNRQLLTQRRNVLKAELIVAEGALERAGVVNEDPDGCASVAKMAFAVGKQVERANIEKEQAE